MTNDTIAIARARATAAQPAEGAFDAVVIGAGVLGTFHAYAAERAGLRTLLLERGEMPAEASVRNFGTLVPSSMEPVEWHDLALQSIGIYEELAGRVPFAMRRGTQYLAGTRRERDVLGEFAALAPAAGYRCRLTDGPGAAALNPAVDQARCLAGLYFPDDRRIESRRALPAVVRWVAGRPGCTYLPRTVAVRVQAEGDRCHVWTAAGHRYTAGQVFVCTGGDFLTLFPDRFAASGLVRCKLSMLRTAPQPGLRMPTTLASGLSIRWYASFRMCDSWRHLAADDTDPELTRRGIHVLMVQDEDGRVVLGDSHEYSAGDLDDVLDARDESLILGVARAMARLPDWRVEERWPGVYPLHPDRPLYTETIGGRIHVVTGIGGKGMTAGPAVAARSVARAFAVDPIFATSR